MAPLLLILALLSSSASRGEDARVQAADAAAAIPSGSDAAARTRAGRAFDGNPEADADVVGRETGGAPRLARSAPAERRAAPEPPVAGGDKKKGSNLSTGLLLGGSAALGGLQGWFAAGALGAVAGAGLGLAAAWLFHKKDYGGAFGVTAGAIIGTALAGPVGGLIGAVVGGVIGHFLGKLFL
ncbi:MAG: hypothetical protein M0D55_01130 [Elusimicrobiota bacterium]|nr:MAG: hypothetical protein M0D55_01130 [Elusimicrobiota bacterium]